VENIHEFKLLVLDDEPGIIDFIQKIYRRRGYVTFGATDGVSALEIFRREKPHISLLDIHMPYSPIDGVETLRKIKEIDKNAICIMVTRISERDKVKLSREYGAFAYLLKPMDIEELDKALNDAKSAINLQ
jgi:DNA-binding response OmpR family regulator